MSQKSYNIGEAAVKGEKLAAGIERYFDALDEVIQARDEIPIDGQDQYVLDGLERALRKKQALADNDVSFLHKQMKSGEEGVFHSLYSVEKTYVNIFHSYNDPQSPIYKQIRGDAKAMAYAQLTSMPIIDELYRMNELKGKTYDKVKGFLEAYEATFMSGEYVKRVNGEIRYYGTNARIKEVYGRNIRKSSYTTFAFERMERHSPLKELKGLSGVINYSEIIYKGIKDLKEYSVTKDKAALEANLISRPIETAATIVTGSAASTAAEGVSVLLIGSSTPVVVFIVAGVAIYFANKCLISPAMEKFKKDYNQSVLKRWEREGQIRGVKELEDLHLKDVDLSQYKEKEFKGGYMW